MAFTINRRESITTSPIPGGVRATIRQSPLSHFAAALVLALASPIAMMIRIRYFGVRVEADSSSALATVGLFILAAALFVCAWALADILFGIREIDITDSDLIIRLKLFSHVRESRLPLKAIKSVGRTRINERNYIWAIGTDGVRYLTPGLSLNGAESLLDGVFSRFRRETD